MQRFTLAQMYQRGYCVGDIDHIIAMKFATMGSKSGAIVLNVQDIEFIDEYFNERAEKSRRWGR